MWLLRLLDHLGLHRAFFTLRYLRGWTPWDTGISPPELVAAVEGPEAEPPGFALDLGCGTGTNSLYLARRGWQVVGVDFAGPAIARATARARAAGTVPSSVRFIRADVTRVGALKLGAPRTLVLDVGCLHGLGRAAWPPYARGVADQTAPGALYLLYAWGPRVLNGRQVGLSAEEVRGAFGAAFTVERIEAGTDRGQPAAWYWLRRNG